MDYSSGKAGKGSANRLTTKEDMDKYGDGLDRIFNKKKTQSSDSEDVVDNSDKVKSDSDK